ncbi:hypothetical protein PLICRDRAFT_48694 [Plicaturopsis crispa FD-325 SS-3]|nr:hypothetical protein PLICRDRAFT_48694 [Plicaturopsis crispa FD-325 SS-3]
MSLKAELDTWAAALKAYDEEDFEKALDLFSRIADASKILCNIGLIYATLGEHEAAVEQFIEATRLDQYLAVAYFQCGVSNFLLARYELALKDFEEALLYLRGNQAINYEQLGLKFKLFSAEVLFNKGLAQIYLGNTQAGLADMEEARREKATEEHNVIDDAIQDRGEGYTVFSIPVGVLYRPSENKLKNSKAKDYMGKARLVAASDSNDVYTTFTGVTRLKQGISPSGAFVEGGDGGALSRSNTVSDPGADLSRSQTTPATYNRGRDDDAPVRPAGGLERSKTTLNVPANARERIAGLSPGGPPSADATSPTRGPGLGRSNTGVGMGGPTRGLSVRKPNAAPPPPAKEVSPTAPQGGNSRLTEIYDDYLDAYNDEPPPPLPTAAPEGGKPDRVGAWARANANPAYPPARQPSRGGPPSSYSPSSYGGGSLRRKVTRRTTRAPSRLASGYEEEEEGYVSGEYEDGPFELIKIRVKLHYQDDVRGMALTPETPFDEFLEKVTSKFGKTPRTMDLKFTDEDGGKVSLRDDSDYEMAIETARESARGKPEGKLVIWCTDA